MLDKYSGPDRQELELGKDVASLYLTKLGKFSALVDGLSDEAMHQAEELDVIWTPETDNAQNKLDDALDSLRNLAKIIREG